MATWSFQLSTKWSCSPSSCLSKGNVTFKATYQIKLWCDLFSHSCAVVTHENKHTKTAQSAKTITWESNLHPCRPGQQVLGVLLLHGLQGVPFLLSRLEVLEILGVPKEIKNGNDWGDMNCKNNSRKMWRLASRTPQNFSVAGRSLWMIILQLHFTTNALQQMKQQSKLSKKKGKIRKKAKQKKNKKQKKRT